MDGVQIEARALGRRLPDGLWLWHHVDLTVEPGHVVGILGRNGSGKTTLLRTMLGLVPPHAGSIAIAPAIGYVPQVSQLTLPFTVREVVSMGRARHVRLFGGLAAADIEVVERTLQHIGLTALAERSFLTLSGGERQLVLIARALASECTLLLLDEPFAALDLDNQHRTLTLLKSLAHSHAMSIVFSAHAPDHVFAVADTVLVLTRGAVPVCGPVNEVLTPAFLRQTYGVTVEVLDITHAGKPQRHAVPLF